LCVNGHRLTAGDAFCTVCGAATAPRYQATPVAGIAPASPAGRPAVAGQAADRRRLMLGGSVLAGLCLAAGLAFIAVEEYRAHTALADTTTRLQNARAKLTTTAHQLSQTKVTLSSTQKDLQQSVTDLNATKARLTSTQSQIQALQQQISGQRTTIANDQQEINDLGTCLDGVSTALADFSDGYPDEAMSALESVGTVCQKAEDNLP
jgi:archaellum component FlaF (FlaF/FlaG flagellin family)